MKEERREYWDIVKGLAIIAVVYGHSAAPQIRIVYFYHLALFFFISGYLYKDKYSVDPYIYTTNKLRGIIFPTIKYYLIFTIFHNIFLKLNIYSSIEGNPMITQVFPYDWRNMIGALFNSLFMTSWETIAGPMWFVKPLFVVMITFCFVRYIAYKIFYKNNIIKEFLVCILVMIIGCIGVDFVTNNIGLPWRAEIALLVVPIVYLGYIASEKLNLENVKWYVGLLCCLVLIFLWKKQVNIDLSANIIDRPIYFYLASLSGIILNLYFAKIILLNKYISKIIALIGSKSFDIMALHLLAFKLVNYFDIIINNKPRWMVAYYPVSNRDLWHLYTVVGIIIPLLVIYVLKFCGEIFKKRFPKLKK